MFDIKNFQAAQARNTSTPAMEINTKRDLTKVINALVYGNQNSPELNPLRDQMANYLKTKGEAAANGDFNAACEINSVFTLIVEPAVLQAANLYGLIGNYHEIGYNETPQVETWELVGGGAREQAYNGDVPFGVWNFNRYNVNTTTVSAGAAVDYRALALGDFDSKMPQMIQYITTDINNKTMGIIVDKVFAALKGNTNFVKFYAEYTGTVTQAAVDNMVNKIYPLGRVTIAGDRSVISVISGWQGYQVVNNTPIPFYSNEMANTVMNTGVLPMYKGSPLVELPNPYDLMKPLADKTGFEQLYPTDRILFLPTGIDSPLNIFRRGGLTSLTAPDLKTGRYLTRYDVEFGVDVVKGAEYKIGALAKQA